MKDRFEELATIWFKKAQGDLLWVKHDLAGKFYGVVCFGCQQIVEKALKAYLFSRKERLIKTHNLLVLLKKSTKHDDTFTDLFQVCKILNGYYTDTRYPDIWDYSRFENKEQAQKAIKLAEKCLLFIRGKLAGKKNLL